MNVLSKLTGQTVGLLITPVGQPFGAAGSLNEKGGRDNDSAAEGDRLQRVD